MKTDDESVIFKEMNDAYTEMQRRIDRKNGRYFSALRVVMSPKFVKDLLRYLNEDMSWSITGVVSKPKGDKQKEDYGEIKFVYINQSCGISGDDYYGFIYVPISSGRFLKVSYSC